jgi:predicted DNA-binding transcriptional regulator AlpA
MSLMTRAYLLDKYGPRLNMEQLSEVLGLHGSTVYNQLSRGEMPVRSYKEGARRFASYEAVAEYLETEGGTIKKVVERANAHQRLVETLRGCIAAMPTGQSRDVAISVLRELGDGS